jgi:hypothetical protein
VGWGRSTGRGIRFRLDPVSGKRELWKELAPSDSVGVVEVRGAAMTRDARAYAYTYARILSNLYLATGFK